MRTKIVLPWLTLKGSMNQSRERRARSSSSAVRLNYVHAISYRGGFQPQCFRLPVAAFVSANEADSTRNRIRIRSGCSQWAGPGLGNFRQPMEARLAYMALTKWIFGKKNMQGGRRGGSYRLCRPRMWREYRGIWCSKR